jgi:Leucine-rich repeat (LRR) protein
MAPCLAAIVDGAQPKVRRCVGPTQVNANCQFASGCATYARNEATLLQALTKLESLSLNNTLVSDAGLAHLQVLTQLRNLYLGNTQVSDTGLQHLEGLTQLENLYLSNTQVSDAGLDGLQKALPNLTIFR